MPRQIINVGTGPNTKNGDPIRNAFVKVNANFAELYNELNNIEIGAVTWDSVTEKPNFSTVATTGNYNDLTNTPTIPTDISQLTDTQGLLATTFDGGGAASEFNEEETIDGGAA
jgi:hypothetical protein